MEDIATALNEEKMKRKKPSEGGENMATATSKSERCFSTQTEIDDPLEMDWYGNYTLHHACGRTPNPNRFDHN